MKFFCFDKVSLISTRDSCLKHVHLHLPISQAVMWKNCALLAKILKMCRKMPICEVKGSGYGATEKNQFLVCYDVFKKWPPF